MVQTDIGTRYALTAILALLMLVGVPSNVLVIGVVVWRKLYQQQPTILLLLNLAVTDQLVCLLVMPWNIVALIAGEFSFGGDDYTRCQVCQTGVIFVILSLVTLNTLAILSVDRLVYLRAAINYHKLVTTPRVLLATVLAWLVSTLITTPPLFGFNEMRFSTAVGICTIAFSGSTHLGKNSHYLILLAIVVLIPIATLIVTNTWGLGIIQNQLRKKSKNLKRDKQNHRKSFHKKLRRQQQTGQVKLVKVYSAIFITNLITYIPMVARLITGVAAEDDEFTQAVRISGSLAYMALLSQAVVHPIVQACLIGDVRRGFTAQLNSVTEQVRKISRNEFSQSTIEDSYSDKRGAPGNGRSLERSGQNWCGGRRSLEGNLSPGNGFSWREAGGMTERLRAAMPWSWVWLQLVTIPNPVCRVAEKESALYHARTQTVPWSVPWKSLSKTATENPLVAATRTSLCL